MDKFPVWAIFLMAFGQMDASEIFRCQQDTSTCLTFIFLKEILNWYEAGEACAQQGKLLASKEELYRHDIQTNGSVWIRIRDEPGKHESQACYFYHSANKYEITEKECEQRLHAICVLEEKKSVSPTLALCSDGSIVSYLGSCKEECERNLKHNCENTVCSQNEHTCEDGSCVSKMHVCDNVVDCLEGSDEDRYCGCEPSEFACGDGQCVPLHGLCTARAEGCRNGKHTAVCAFHGIDVEVNECDSWEFSCGDGQCIPKPGMCSDNMTKCSNGEDRKHCKYVRPEENDVAAVMTGNEEGSDLSAPEIVLLCGICLLALFILIGVPIVILKKRKKKEPETSGETRKPLNP